MRKQNEHTPQSGLVISYFGNSVAVEAPDGQVFQCHLRRNQPLPVVGDTVLWQLEQENTATVLSIEPRRSVLARGDGHDHDQKKLLAANVDIMAVVMAPPPVFSDFLVDRYLVAAELLGITPVLVMNKIDLLDETQRAAVEKILQRYRSIYAVVMTSVIANAGLVELKQLLDNKISVLIGPSGVGKSSIISTLAGQDIRVGEVSPKGVGKHTTTATRFYHLTHGGLIDSPGVRDFSLWAISREEVLKGFKEFTPFLTGCKFRDCRHVAEPDCAVQTAVAAGKISQERYANYQRLMSEAIKKK